MQSQYKLGLLVLIYGVFAIVTLSAAYPAFVEEQEKLSELNVHKEEDGQLTQKLADRKKAEAEKKSLETDIEMLRSAVPKSAELDLMIMDLERFCHDSGVDLIAVEPPQASSIKASEQEVSELLGTTEGKVTLGSKTLEKATASAGKAATATNAIEKDMGLKQSTREVYVTGNFNGIVALLKKLESYRRVVGINRIAIAIAREARSGSQDDTASERARKLKLNEPVMSFLLTLYYLP